MIIIIIVIYLNIELILVWRLFYDEVISSMNSIKYWLIDFESVDPVKQESATESFTKSLSANVDPIREDQVQNAMKFLSHPKVRTSPIIHRRSFLEKKGLTREEIDEAFRRVPVSDLFFILFLLLFLSYIPTSTPQ